MSIVVGTAADDMWRHRACSVSPPTVGDNTVCIVCASAVFLKALFIGQTCYGYGVARRGEARHSHSGAVVVAAAVGGDGEGAVCGIGAEDGEGVAGGAGGGGGHLGVAVLDGIGGCTAGIVSPADGGTGGCEAAHADSRRLGARRWCLVAEGDLRQEVALAAVCVGRAGAGDTDEVPSVIAGGGMVEIYQQVAAIVQVRVAERQGQRPSGAVEVALVDLRQRGAVVEA